MRIAATPDGGPLGSSIFNTLLVRMPSLRGDFYRWHDSKPAMSRIELYRLGPLGPAAPQSLDMSNNTVDFVGQDFVPGHG